VGHRFHVDLLHAFNVSGKPYKGTKLKFGPMGGVNDRATSQAIVERYPQ
jgi:hypothetical protein